MIWKLLRRLKWLIVPILERWYRLKDRVKLLLLALTGRSTVLEQYNLETLDGDVAVIFATYPTEMLASCHVRFLDYLTARGCNIFVTTNHPAWRKVLAPIMDRPWAFQFRRPFGRDFGCYKDATLSLYQVEEARGRPYKRVIYLNDSIVTMSNAEPQLADYLLDERYHCCGITENYDKYQHIGSFVMAISGEVFHHPKVVKYWNRYVPLSTRRHAILKGELGFSKVLKQAGYKLHIQWTLARMKEALLQVDFPVLHAIVTSMEPHFKGRFPTPVNVYDNRLTALLGVDPAALAPAQGRRKKAQKLSGRQDVVGQGGYLDEDAEAPLPGMVGYRERFLGLGEDVQVSIFQTSAREALVDEIMANIFRGSQIHHGAAPLLFLGAGLMKKDVVLRMLVEPYNIDKLLAESGACEGQERADAVMEVLAKGHPYSLRGKARLMHDWDFV
jgi:hypothetical protein